VPPPPAGLLAADKAGFDLLLIAHVAAALVGFGSLVTSGIQAARLARAGPGRATPTLWQYFAPGVNWAGRTLYLVPLLGFALLADSNGGLRLGEAWAVAGLALWSGAAVAAEGVLWPAERRIQAGLAVGAPDGTALRRDCRVVEVAGALLGAVFLVATVLMVARPG